MARIRSVGRKLSPMVQLNPRWGPSMMGRSSHAAQQVACLTGDQGSEWIHGLDELPAPVRHRLAESSHNICPICMNSEAGNEARRRGLRCSTLAIYSEVISAIEQKLEQQPVGGQRAAYGGRGIG